MTYRILLLTLLYGTGHRASLYAVMAFLENSIGWRWYSVFEKPVVPRHSTLTLKPFHRRRRFDFRRRHLALRYNVDFYLQHGVNMGLETKLLKRVESVPEHLRSWMPNENFVHTTFSNIPPTPQGRYANEFSWLKNRNYFATNPEFFSLSEAGRRVPNLQLCFSNRGLRDEFTAQVRRHISVSGERQIIMVDAADRPGRFCHCAGCVALEEKHTDHVYGPAATLVRRYLADLENARKAMKSFAPGVTYKSRNFDDRTFPYLTTTSIHRWQQSFERMLELTADSPRHRSNIEVLRRELDIATLRTWFGLKKSFPDAYTDHRGIAERIAAANVAGSAAGIKAAWKLGEEVVADFVTLIEAGGEKPLPAQFSRLPADRVRSYLPVNSRRGESRRNLRDPEAAFGLATVVDQPGQPFRCGFAEWKSRTPRRVLRGPDLEVTPADIKPGEYQLHRLGEFNVTTDDSLIWFGRSWLTSVAIGSRLHFPGETSRWEAWVNLKFDGESWGGKGEDLVVCDRVILVRKGDP